MKKVLVWSIRIFAIFLFLTLGMYMFKLCPPAGPWPMPPWCVAVEPFNYQELDYIQKSFSKTAKQLDFGIGTYDIWGNPHLFADLGDDTRNNYVDTINRIGDINTELYLITDLVTFADNGTILYSEDDISSGMSSIGTDYMKAIGELVRSNGIKKFMHLTNLADFKDDIDDYLSRGLNVAEKAVGDEYKRQTESAGAYVSSTDIDSYSIKQWDTLFSRWTETLVLMAKKNEASGVTHMIINPGDTLFNYRIDYDYQQKKYREVVNEVKKYYSGKIGVHGRVDEVVNMDWEFIDFYLISFNADSDWMLDEDLREVSDDVDSIKNGLNKYFSRGVWNNITKESYLSITIPSIKDGLKIGWLPQSELNKYTPDQKAQAIAYEAIFQTLYNNTVNINGVVSYGYWWNDRLFPETKVLRNDNDYTIRNKDAEKVFYKWSNIFS